MLSYQFIVILRYKNDNITAFFTDKILYSLTLKKNFLPLRGKKQKLPRRHKDAKEKDMPFIFVT